MLYNLKKIKYVEKDSMFTTRSHLGKHNYIMSADLYNVLVLYNTFLFYSQPFDKRVCWEKEASFRRLPPSCKYWSRNRSPQSPYSGKATPTGQPQATE